MWADGRVGERSLRINEKSKRLACEFAVACIQYFFSFLSGLGCRENCRVEFRNSMLILMFLFLFLPASPAEEMVPHRSGFNFEPIRLV